jgi:ankyrin repeat protein
MTIIELNKGIIQENNLERFDLNATGGVNEWTSLHLAAHGGHLEIVRDLVENGADIF